jgi:hypothetical protein
LELPQSFHKFLYGHGDPVNGIDPSGQFIPLLLGMALGSALFGAFASALYVTLEGGSATDIAWAGAYGFGAGLVTGLAAGSIVAALGYAAAAGGGSAGIGYAMGGFIVGSASLPLAIDQTVQAFRNGDNIDRTFAVVGLTANVAGLVSSSLAVWTLTTRGGAISRAAVAWQAGSNKRYAADWNWLDTKAYKGNVVVGPIAAENAGNIGPFFTTMETLQGRNGLVDQVTLADRLQIRIGNQGPRTKMGIYEFIQDDTVARGVPRANGNFGRGGWPQLFVENAGQKLKLIRVVDLSPQ